MMINIDKEARVQAAIEARRRETEAQLKAERERAITLDEEEPVAGCRYNGELVTPEMLSDEVELTDRAAQMSTQPRAVRTPVFEPSAQTILRLIALTYSVPEETALEWLLRAGCDLGETA